MSPLPPPMEDARAVEVTGEHNGVVARASGHSWIGLFRDGIRLTAEMSGRPEAAFAADAGQYEIRTDGTLELVEARAFDNPELARFRTVRPRLSMTSDAPDTHVVDDVGEITGDGTSFCTITVERVGMDQEPLRGKDGAGQVYLRATGGVIMDKTGRSHIRSVRLRAGRASFRFVSDSLPRLVTLHAFDGDSEPAELAIEFV
jgi:hypothetical protein